jgi:hypothetical protein
MYPFGDGGNLILSYRFIADAMASMARSSCIVRGVAAETGKTIPIWAKLLLHKKTTGYCRQAAESSLIIKEEVSTASNAEPRRFSSSQ